ncbi:Protein-tyrosine phosphatase, low molecular weight [Desulfurispirillum indicum S5]|uniref:Protein-tyrosine phosphatase, low molecular weight n=1 Tax=Desulfurispirillum indicum (strain ATCC BAA-1389 / DSM 22839 / S5) TaxID=653733 RepID=E6W749_DESIS|nr:arsenate reductase ArsC [Desulfurispirillum indicum]ADU65127.1 Protein-tyrosine phosphatase, low molecular weight [Desulfurispirillum indicum S5]
MKTRVGFICVHNSCRSQMAEALGTLLAADVFESYSAGTHVKPAINADAVRIIRELYGVDMARTQRSKLLGDIPELDIVITMGCNVDCPMLPCKHREDWGLDDPTGQSDEVFVQTARTIEAKVRELARRIEAGEFKKEHSVKCPEI